MMAEGDAQIVADRLHAVLSKPPVDPGEDAGPAGRRPVGRWDVKIQYAASASTHRFQLRQKGAEIEGAHQGDFVTRDLTGSIDGDGVRLRSNVGEQAGDAFSFTFTGKIAGDQLTGTLDMAEYLGATFTATRRAGGGGHEHGICSHCAGRCWRRSALSQSPALRRAAATPTRQVRSAAQGRPRHRRPQQRRRGA